MILMVRIYYGFPKRDTDIFTLRASRQNGMKFPMARKRLLPNSRNRHRRHLESRLLRYFERATPFHIDHSRSSF